MKNKRTQKNREASFQVFPRDAAESVDPDLLMLKKAEGFEYVGEAFRFTLDLISTNDGIAPEFVIGRRAAIRLSLSGEPLESSPPTRVYAGVVAAFHRMQEKVEGDDSLFRYRAVMVPTAWWLTLNRDCRVFKGKTAEQIARSLCDRFDARVESWNITRTLTPRKHCVQYRETDFDFMCRLLEEEGVYFYFRHDDTDAGCRDVLVLSDSMESNPESEGILARADGQPREEDILAWREGAEAVSSLFTHSDFDFTRPWVSGRMSSRSGVTTGFDMPEAAVFDYPGGFNDDKYANPGPGGADDLGSVMAGVRAFETASGRRPAAGTTRMHRDLAPGCVLLLNGGPKGERRFFLTSTRVIIESDDYLSAHTPSKPLVFECSFEAQEYEVSDPSTGFRPRRKRRKPVIPGLQTAEVIAPEGSGEEIWTDDWGRVKIRFNWERPQPGADEEQDESRTCWVRVAQPWAGAGFGAMFIPRVGQEVVVAFMDGDPDLPLLVGSVYGSGNKPPYPLPGKASLSYVRSSSTPGGVGSNEIRFEDKAGEEQVFNHAQMYSDRIVESESCDDVLDKRHEVTMQDRLERDEADRHTVVTGEMRLNVGGDLSSAVEGNRKEKIGGDAHLTVAGDRKDALAADHHEVVGNDRMTSIGNDRHTSIANSEIIQVGSGGRFLTVTGPNAEIIAGQNFQQVAAQHYLAAGQVVIQTTGGVCIQNAASTILVDPTGITIKGPLVQLNPPVAVPMPGIPVPPTSPSSPATAEEGAEAWPAKNAADSHITGPWLILEMDGKIMRNGSTADCGYAFVDGGSGRTFRAFNAGTGELAVKKIEVVAHDDGPEGSEDDFSVSPDGLTVPENGSAEFDVDFEPTEIRDRKAVLRITADSLDDPLEIILTGVGVAPEIGFGLPGGPAIDAKSGPLHLADPPATGVEVKCFVEVRNTGLDKLSVSGVTIEGKGASAFKVSPTAFIVDAGDSQTLDVSIGTKIPEKMNAVISVDSDAVNDDGGDLAVEASGSALILTQPAPPEVKIGPFGIKVTPQGTGPLVLSGAPVVLKETEAGAYSVSKFHLVNLLDSSLDVKSFFTGDGASDGQLSVSPARFTMGGHENADLTVTFKPGAGGDFRAQLRVCAGDCKEAGAIVVGKALAAILKLSMDGDPLDPSASIDFGNHPAGGKTTRKLKIANSGDSKLRIDSIEIAGVDGAKPPAKNILSVKPDKLAVDPGKDGEITLEFAPCSAGELTAVLDAITNDPSLPRLKTPLRLGAVGLQILDGTRLLGDGDEFFAGAATVKTNLEKSLKLNNPSKTELKVKVGKVTGAAAKRFVVTPDEPTVPAEGWTMLKFVFNSADPGTFEGDIGIESQAEPARPYKLKVTGTATALNIKDGDKALTRGDTVTLDKPGADGISRKSVTVSNPGKANVAVRCQVRHEGDAEEFWADPPEFIVKASGEQKIDVTAQPAPGGDRRGCLQVFAGDGGSDKSFDLILTAKGE